MPITTAEIWSAWANIPLSNANERLSVQMICNQVDVAIKKRLKRTVEQRTFTGLIVDAPDSPYLILTRYAPITISSFQCWYNGRANGNPASFDVVNDLLAPYTDYDLDRDEEDPLLSTGIVRKISGIWGISYRRRSTQLAYQQDPNHGALKLTFQGGWAVVPPNIVLAANQIVSMVLGNRKYGYNIGSESWNGYSYNIPGVGLMVNGVMGNPDISSVLDPYINRAAEVG